MSGEDRKEQQGQPSVRFASQNEEISPEVSLSPVVTLTGEDGKGKRELNPAAEEEIKQLKSTLQQAVQSQRAEQFSFEPVSLPGSQPVSRVPSGSRLASRVLPAGSLSGTPRPSPPHSAIHSPPLTPASTGRDGRPPTTIPSISLTQRARAQADVVTPQRSSSPDARPKSRPSSISGASGAVSAQPRPTPRFSIGPSAESGPPSEDASPAPTPGTQTPIAEPTNKELGAPTSDIKSDEEGSKVSPTSTKESRDAMFRFGNRDPRHGYSTSSTNVTLGAPTFSASSLSGPGTGSLMHSQPSSSSSSINQLKTEDKRPSFFGSHKSDKGSERAEEHHKEKSSSNLKRFFKFGSHSKKEKDKGEGTGTKTPPNGTIPFADDHGLESKYGKFGRMLGSGAGGSVRLMKRTADGKTFAVKQFRNRHAYESEKEYNKKVTSEFCIGSTLHHGNIVETIDIVHEKAIWYEVMEYCPYDLFATVMTGKMGRDEVTCATLQILSGVMYLHSMGLAHRDLKLDNVVINEHGIMKIIDFGSAVVFRYPFENDIVLATGEVVLLPILRAGSLTFDELGVVGSDPYLAPEVYDNTRYDPQMADVWSIAIIFCCMCLRRFPWKAPRMSDNSYRLFVSPPDPGQDELLNPSRKSSQPSSRTTTGGSSDTHHHHHHHSEKKEEKSQPSGGEQPTIKGPIRLLRLLPRDTRVIIGRMLELDPKKRATIDEILQNEWVQNALVCRQEEGGVCYHAPNHRHHLEGSGQSLVTSKK
ncbi:hypothetical protein CAC42_6237 [Sphaceloma murrayae]|uniref:non-specific serine/threonine protein kinase n=1 Tax=Sphaceloma murrayae TaxID=2082308 RepID=A0A2K1QTY6_9PEZI|nr:hypothetical protein CAC42_6237 [Sphaceloma murrayae]